MDNRPIGVFDSGIGGLTVVDAITNNLSNEDIIYVGDTARVPYGNKSKNRIRQYATEITKWLIKQDCKIIVVACNTVSALALDYLNSTFSIPIIGVIDPGVEKAVEISQNNKIAVLGTSATIRSDAYGKRLKAIKPEVVVTSQACPLFVPLAEEGWIDGEIPFQIATYYFSSLKKMDVDTVILGCTHYPLLKKTIHSCLGDHIRLVDSGEAVVKNVISEVEKMKGLSSSTRGKIRCYVTDDPTLFNNIARRFCMKNPEQAVQIDL